MTVAALRPRSPGSDFFKGEEGGEEEGGDLPQDKNITVQPNQQVMFPHDSVENQTQVAATPEEKDARQPSLICTLCLSSGRLSSRRPPPLRPPSPSLCPVYSAVSQQPPTSGSLFIRHTRAYRFPGRGLAGG